MREREGARRQGKAGEGERERKHGQVESLGGGKGDGGPGRERNRPPDRKFRNFLRGSGKNHTTQFEEKVVETVVNFFDDICDFLEAKKIFLVFFSVVCPFHGEEKKRKSCCRIPGFSFF